MPLNHQYQGATATLKTIPAALRLSVSVNFGTSSSFEDYLSAPTFLTYGVRASLLSAHDLAPPSGRAGAFSPHLTVLKLKAG